MNYKVEVIINKDINTVFEKLTSPEFMVEWQENLTDQYKDKDDNWVYVDNHSWKKMEITENILEKNAPNIFRVEYITNGVINIMNNSLERIDENTTKWVSENEFKFTNWMMRIIGVLFSGSFPKQTKKDMAAFKAAVEKLT